MSFGELGTTGVSDTVITIYIWQAHSQDFVKGGVKLKFIGLIKNVSSGLLHQKRITNECLRMNPPAATGLEVWEQSYQQLGDFCDF